MLEAIDGLGPDGEGIDHLEEELGDLLFQVVFHATLAAEEGWFTLADVARGIHDKLVHRHPHVFGAVEADTADQVMTNWEQIKQGEKGRASMMDGIPGHLPSLLYAHKVQRKAASVGFDWDGVAGAWPKIAEETAELEAAMAGGSSAAGDSTVAEELGDLLFAVVNVARHLDIDPEAALRAATAKFRDRFEARRAAGRGAGRDPRRARPDRPRRAVGRGQGCRSGARLTGCVEAPVQPQDPSRRDLRTQRVADGL